MNFMILLIFMKKYNIIKIDIGTGTDIEMIIIQKGNIWRGSCYRRNKLKLNSKMHCVILTRMSYGGIKEQHCFVRCKDCCWSQNKPIKLSVTGKIKLHEKIIMESWFLQLLICRPWGLMDLMAVPYRYLFVCKIIDNDTIPTMNFHNFRKWINIFLWVFFSKQFWQLLAPLAWSR